jgi:DNA primase
MFPILDGRGRVLGFGARTLGDDVPKYLNTPRSAVFDKSQVLYGLSEARRGIQREGSIGIVEGYTDAIMAHQAGLDFVVASLGTAFTEENARRLGRMAPKVLLIFDGDAAGQKASERSLDLLVGQSLDVRVYSVKDGKDPCDAILALGGEEFRRRLERESVGLFEFKWKRTMEAQGVAESGPVVRARALDEFLSLLAKVPNVVARKLYVREFAEKMGISEKDMEARLEQKGLRPGRLDPRRLGSQRLNPEKWTPKEGNPKKGNTGRPVGPAKEGDEPGGARASEEGSRAAAGEAPSGRRGPEKRGLEDLILECVLALPQRGQEILSQVPGAFFQDPVLCRLAEAVKRQLEDGSLAPERLIREVDDPEVEHVLLGILGRIETDDGSPACDYEEVWRLARRDLERHVEARRVEELRRLMAQAREAGDGAGFATYQRDYFEVLRNAKRARRKV